MRLLTYICIAMLISSCSLIDNDDPIPGFLVLDNPTVITNEAFQGEATHNITTVWVFDGQTFLGIFPIPAKVPVILDGSEKTFTIFAGVRNNGVSNNSLRYPFYEPVNVTANLTAQEERVVALNFNYSENAIFDIIENFEGSHIFIQDPNIADSLDTEILIQSEVLVPNGLGGNNAGQIIFESDSSAFERTTLITFNRQDNSGSSTFIEIDYKCDIPFLAGWITYENNFIERDYPVLVAPSNEWKKIYIDISEAVGAVEIDRYTMALASAITIGDEIPSTIYIDNIKLVHF